jgi:hypothetical protein
MAGKRIPTVSFRPMFMSSQFNTVEEQLFHSNAPPRFDTRDITNLKKEEERLNGNREKGSSNEDHPAPYRHVFARLPRTSKPLGFPITARQSHPVALNRA